MIKKRKKIYIGLSGGVDSSVAALLLQQAGHDVEGVFIRTWQPDWTPCTWKQDRRDAMRVCAKLGIKYNELDLEDTYKKEVADYMIAEYRAGRTPNPDVMCNRAVKFGGFLKWALDQGADAVATGHYARVIESEGKHQLLRGIDAKKDQSYFLWTLTEKQLQHILFPVGHLPKKKVRSIAQRHNLITATKKDSQGVCFLGEIDMAKFLQHYIDTAPGDVQDEAGNIIGRHSGALLYTLGQRHGFTITKKSTNDAPRYVVTKDIEANTITVSETVVPRSESRTVTLGHVNRIDGGALRMGERVEAEIRYHGNLQSAVVEHVEKNSMTLIFDTYDPTLASGQSVVLYDGDQCLGGGVVT